MNILDENVPEGQLVLLRRARIPIRQIGDEVGRAGMKDHAIIPLLHELDRPTLFTLDSDFYDRRLRHEKYCLVHLDIDEDMVAEFVRRLLRHSELNTKAKRIGCVIRAMPAGITAWRIGHGKDMHLSWS